MKRRFPLPTLLSQALVAFTIEFDNEFEHRMPHRTTNHGSTPGSRQGPWLVSLVMWPNCMRFVGERGVRVGDLEDLARTKTNLNGMERWGYVVIGPDPADRRAKPPRSSWLIRATPNGRKAQEIWPAVFDVIETRWRTRFGEREIEQLRGCLVALDSEICLDLPDCLPILGYGLFSRGPVHGLRTVSFQEDCTPSRLSLLALLSRVLLAFAIEFERESEFSLAISANGIRVLDEKGVLVRDLPLLTGVSKEAVSMILGVLQKRGAAVVEVAGSRAKAASLTSKGRVAYAAYGQLLIDIEERWRGRFGEKTMVNLRASLEPLIGESDGHPPPLFSGLEPYPDGWRAAVARPKTLPHYPMVLHRGGFPDGS